jgi:hypothetical protein
MFFGKVTGQALGVSFRSAQCRRITMNAQHHVLHIADPINLSMGRCYRMLVDSNGESADDVHH